jgi:cytochrome c oxidase subunit 3
VVGFASFLNGAGFGLTMMLAGLAITVFMMFGWFGTVIRESEAHMYNSQVDKSFRWGMSWFIFSEVMFFAVFFGALFWTRVMSVPDLASLEHNTHLWPGFTSHWPSAGPGFEEKFSPMGAWGIPALNTLLLLSSEDKRGLLNLFLFLTIALGVVFIGFQAYEYSHAYSELNLKLSTGAYGSTFFMLTGFHGFHVTVGAIMLTVIWFRCLSGHFKPDHHFAFEGVAWYWHFVDVVWLGLFIFVYWL